MDSRLTQLADKYPDLTVCLPDIQKAADLMVTCYRQGGKLLVCGNGGSAADAEHIVAELMKGYLRRRPLAEPVRQRLIDAFPEEGLYLAEHLQGALPAISLVSQTSLTTAYANDVAADMAFAQQVFGYGKPGDVLLALSTSGNSANVRHAAQVARVLGLHPVGLTGQGGGALKAICEVTICVPWVGATEVQERHLPIYHGLCAMLEAEFFA